MFCSYAAFWLSCWWIVPRLALAGDTHNALGLFLLDWMISTAHCSAPSKSAVHQRARPARRTPGFRRRAPGRDNPRHERRHG
ncbi:hypothetical protein [Streptomyces sp. NPDC002550]